MSSLVKKGFQISRSVLFRLLLLRASGFLRRPSRVFFLTQQAHKRVNRYQGIGEFTADLAGAVKQLFRLVTAYVKGDYKGISRTNILLVIAVIGYFLSPLDIIPDAIPILGMLDDLSLFSWMMSTITKEMQDFVEWEKQFLPAPGETS